MAEKIKPEILYDERLRMNFKELRLKLGVSQAELARKLDVSAVTANRWESGKTTPSRMAKRTIKEMFGVEIK